MIFFNYFILIIFTLLPLCVEANSMLQTGDIIFHISKSQQSLGIQKATNSPYSHMGLIVNNHGKFYVLEAIQPVQYTPLDKWIHRGVNRHYVVKRYIYNLTEQQKNKLITNAEQYLGKPYDIYFAWDDRSIYCSEIVWKSYHHALGIVLAPLAQLQDFNLNSPEVKKLMQQRYGKNIPLKEKVIAPQAIYESKQLKDVFRNKV